MVRIEHLTCRRGGRAVIDDLTLHVRPGEKVCLFGPSGAGKSTLVQLLLGLLPACGGAAAVKARRRAAVFQAPGLFWYKTLAANIFYPIELQGIPIDGPVRSRYAGWLDAAGLAGAEALYPHQVSGGMQQQAALVRAFLAQPELVLLDEPFTSIDAVAKRRIIAHIRQACPGVTLLWITHAVDEIPLMADRLLVFGEMRLSAYREIAVSPDIGLDRLAAAIFGAGDRGELCPCIDKARTDEKEAQCEA